MNDRVTNAMETAVSTAADAGANGCTATLVVDDSEQNQQFINNQIIKTVESVSDLINIRNPRNGQVVFVRNDSINYSYDGISWEFASETKISNDGELQVLSRGV